MYRKKINIALVGKTGHGKSATGNTILDRKVFKSSDSSTSCTQVCQLESAKHDDLVVNVIDTPGLVDTSKTEQEIFKSLKDALSFCQGGINAFIFVLRWGVKCTDEEYQTFNKIKSFFGSDFLKVCIIVFTHGDIYETCADDPKPFDQWLQEQEGMLREIIKECDSRIVLFYNSKRPEFLEKRQAAVSQLFTMILDNNMIYNDDTFKKAEESRKQMAFEDKLPQLQAKYQEKLSLLQAKIENASINSRANYLQSLKEEGKGILDSILDDAKNIDSNILKQFENHVEIMIKHINSLTLSTNVKEKLQKIAEYNNLLKNPPSKVRFVSTGIESVLGLCSATVGIAATMILLPKQPSLAAMSLGLGSLVLAGGTFFNLGKTSREFYLELQEYNKRLAELDTEIKHIN